LPLPVTQVRITGPEGGVAPGDSGQIEVRGPTLCAGYLNRDGPSPMTADGWFQTGDLGYRDDDGYLFVVERRDDLIVSGGENISPAEIERVLLAHPAVADAGVVGIPDETWGARPVAAVVWRGEPDAAEALLLAYCRDRLAAYKLPQRVLVREELPRSASGKLLRRTLRELILEAFRAERR
jgi:O-succinylbenzoic acid--CoA ligase